MTEVESYLVQVRRKMRGMDPHVREDILRELNSHLAESAANGADMRRALADLGPPDRVGREYRKVYGYGGAFKILFAAVAVLLAIPSSPVLQVTSEFPLPNALAVPFLVALIAWLLWVSVEAGSKAGLLAGVAAFVARIGVEVWLAATPPYPTPAPDGRLLFAAAGILLVLVGWLPGTAKKAWSRPSGDL